MNRSTFLSRVLGLAVAVLAVAAPVLVSAAAPDTATVVAADAPTAVSNGFSWG